MTTLNISLPDEVRSLADEQVASGRFASVSDYVASLIREDGERAERQRVEGLLLRRLNAGPARDVTDGDFDAIRSRLESEIARRRTP